MSTLSVMWMTRVKRIAHFKW